MAEKRGTRPAGGRGGRSGAGSGGGGGGGGGDSGNGDAGEFRSSPEVKTALIEGRTFVGKAVQYVVLDGEAIFEGDIVLGTADEVAAKTEELRLEASGQVARGVVRTGSEFRWPNCRVPYTIDAALPNQNRVTEAIAHWESNTQYRFPVRTSEADYVTFRPGSGCSAFVGRKGGQQFVTLGSGCTTGNVIHEIGHVVGLWHEQSREDRDAFVTIHWAKIQAGFEHNFNQHIVDGDDVGAYDYGSIMHYPRNAFSVDGSDTITPVQPGATIGQRTAMSQGDIAAANSLCPPKLVKEGPKDPIKEIRKDVRIDTRKEIIKDVRFDTRKEMILDTRKELIKEHFKEVALDPPFKRAGGDVIQPGGRVVLPGQTKVGPGVVRPGAVPFAVAVPHAAPGAGDDDLAGTVAELDAQLTAVAEQLTQAEATRDALQAQYDELAGLLGDAVQAHDQPPT